MTFSIFKISDLKLECDWLNEVREYKRNLKVETEQLIKSFDYFGHKKTTTYAKKYISFGFFSVTRTKTDVFHILKAENNAQI